MSRKGVAKTENAGVSASGSIVPDGKGSSSRTRKDASGFMERTDDLCEMVDSGKKDGASEDENSTAIPCLLCSQVFNNTDNLKHHLISHVMHTPISGAQDRNAENEEDSRQLGTHSGVTQSSEILVTERTNSAGITVLHHSKYTHRHNGHKTKLNESVKVDTEQYSIHDGTQQSLKVPVQIGAGDVEITVHNNGQSLVDGEKERKLCGVKVETEQHGFQDGTQQSSNRPVQGGSSSVGISHPTTQSLVDGENGRNRNGVKVESEQQGIQDGTLLSSEIPVQEVFSSVGISHHSGQSHVDGDKETKLYVVKVETDQHSFHNSTQHSLNVPLQEGDNNVGRTVHYNGQSLVDGEKGKKFDVVKVETEQHGFQDGTLQSSNKITAQEGSSSVGISHHSGQSHVDCEKETKIDELEKDETRHLGTKTVKQSSKIRVQEVNGSEGVPHQGVDFDVASGQNCKLGESAKLEARQNVSQNVGSQSSQHGSKHIWSDGLVFSCNTCNFFCSRILKSFKSAQCVKAFWVENSGDLWCRICERKCGAAVDLLEHVYKQHASICSICQRHLEVTGRCLSESRLKESVWQRFFQQILLQIPRHMHLHTCKYCGDVLADVKSYRSHVEAEHPASAELLKKSMINMGDLFVCNMCKEILLTCNICFKVFRLQSSMSRHMKLFHPEVPQDNQELDKKCRAETVSKCPSSFTKHLRKLLPAKRKHENAEEERGQLNKKVCSTLSSKTPVLGGDSSAGITLQQILTNVTAQIVIIPSSGMEFQGANISETTVHHTDQTPVDNEQECKLGANGMVATKQLETQELVTPSSQIQGTEGATSATTETTTHHIGHSRTVSEQKVDHESAQVKTGQFGQHDTQNGATELTIIPVAGGANSAGMGVCPSGQSCQYYVVSKQTLKICENAAIEVLSTSQLVNLSQPVEEGANSAGIAPHCSCHSSMANRQKSKVGESADMEVKQHGTLNEDTPPTRIPVREGAISEETRLHCSDHCMVTGQKSKLESAAIQKRQLDPHDASKSSKENVQETKSSEEVKHQSGDYDMVSGENGKLSEPAKTESRQLEDKAKFKQVDSKSSGQIHAYKGKMCQREFESVKSPRVHTGSKRGKYSCRLCKKKIECLVEWGHHMKTFHPQFFMQVDSIRKKVKQETT